MEVLEALEVGDQLVGPAEPDGMSGDLEAFARVDLLEALGKGGEHVGQRLERRCDVELESRAAATLPRTRPAAVPHPPVVAGARPGLDPAGPRGNGRHAEELGHRGLVRQEARKARGERAPSKGIEARRQKRLREAAERLSVS